MVALVWRGAAHAQGAPVLVGAAPVPQERPWAVSAQMSFFVNGAPAYASAGVAVERVLTRHLRLDGDLGTGLPSTVATTTGDVHVEQKLDVSARARGTLPLGYRDRHALFVGVGPHLSFGGAYGQLWQGRAEVGYGFRAAGGFSFLYALGAELVLADRPAPIAAGTCATSSCPGALSAGNDLTTVVRAALGYAF
jgi:hypothetical protein